MRKLNLSVGAVIFLCMLILSYTHTSELFARGGYDGYYSHIGVIACEALFILSTINIIVCRLNSRKVPFPIRIGSAVSILVIGWSNISSGISNGWESIAIGALIPIILIVGEMVVSHAMFNQQPRRKRETGDEETAQNIAHSITHSDTRFAQSVTHVADREGSHSVNKPVPGEKPPVPDKKPLPGEIAQPIARPVIKSGASKPPNPSPDSSTSPGSALEWAKYLYEETGKPPSRRKLAEKAGVSEHKARTALTELKAQLQIS